MLVRQVMKDVRRSVPAYLLESQVRTGATPSLVIGWSCQTRFYLFYVRKKPQVLILRGVPTCVPACFVCCVGLSLLALLALGPER